MGERRLFYRFARLILGSLFRWGYRPAFYGVENIPAQGPVILAGNHKSAFDPFIVAVPTKRTIRFLAKKELKEGPLSFFYANMAIIPVDRSKKDSGMMELLGEVIGREEVICFFAEGKRNRTNKLLLPFKPGAAALAVKTDTAIIPFAITGQYKFLRDGVRIRFGLPLDMKGLSPEEANWLLKKRVEEMLLEDRKPLEAGGANL